MNAHFLVLILIWQCPQCRLLLRLQSVFFNSFSLSLPSFCSSSLLLSISLSLASLFHGCFYLLWQNGTNPIVKAYDIVAVQPSSEKLLHQCAQHLEVDIISFGTRCCLESSTLLVSIRVCLRKRQRQTKVTHALKTEDLFIAWFSFRLFSQAAVLCKATCGDDGTRARHLL